MKNINLTSLGKLDTWDSLGLFYSNRLLIEVRGRLRSLLSSDFCLSLLDCNFHCSVFISLCFLKFLLPFNFTKFAPIGFLCMFLGPCSIKVNCIRSISPMDLTDKNMSEFSVDLRWLSPTIFMPQTSFLIGNFPSEETFRHYNNF